MDIADTSNRHSSGSSKTDFSFLKNSRTLSTILDCDVRRTPFPGFLATLCSSFTPGLFEELVDLFVSMILLPDLGDAIDVYWSSKADLVL